MASENEFKKKTSSRQMHIVTSRNGESTRNSERTELFFLFALAVVQNENKLTGNGIRQIRLIPLTTYALRIGDFLSVLATRFLK